MKYNRLKYYLLILNLLILPLYVSLSSSTSVQKYSIYEVRAAYLYNFSKFVQWPNNTFDSENAPFIIGIYGDDPFGSIIHKTLEGRKINGRNWIIEHYNSPEEIIKCNILFIADTPKTELLKISETIKGKPILSVGDNIDNFCESGGMINFTQQYSKHRFQINNNSALQSNLIISSKLLALAKIIEGDEIRF